MIYGFDVSNWQGSFNWDGRSIRFAFAKATEGTTYTDAQFARNWSQMASHRLVRGAYHFGHPSSDPIIEAEHFLSVVRGQGLHDGDLLALDLETDDGRSPASVAAWARRWCAHVQQRTGRRPLVYTYISYARGGYCAGLGAYPLWIAAPSFPAGKPPMPLGPWKQWAVHQYTDSPIDKDVSPLTVAQLRALGTGSTPEEDEVSDYVSVGQTKPQKFPDSKWITVEFDTEYEDSDHNHWNKGGASVVTGPARYRLNCYSKITGLPVGAPAQIRLTRVDDKTGDRAEGPILEFSGSTGDAYVFYVVAADYIGAGRKTRIELIQWSGQDCVLEWSQLKAEVTPQ